MQTESGVSYKRRAIVLADHCFASDHLREFKKATVAPVAAKGFKVNDLWPLK